MSGTPRSALNNHHHDLKGRWRPLQAAQSSCGETWSSFTSVFVILLGTLTNITGGHMIILDLTRNKQTNSLMFDLHPVRSHVSRRTLVWSLSSPFNSHVWLSPALSGVGPAGGDKRWQHVRDDSQSGRGADQEGRTSHPPRPQKRKRIRARLRWGLEHSQYTHSTHSSTHLGLKVIRLVSLPVSLWSLTFNLFTVLNR